MRIGEVRNIRELRRGLQAEVCVGATGKYGYTTLRVVATSPRVQKALSGLRAALREEAHEQLLAAQKDTIIRTGDAIGVPE